MWFTVEDRYLRLPTSTTLKVLHLAEKEATDSMCRVNVSLTSTQQDYQVRSTIEVEDAHYLVVPALLVPLSEF